MAKPLTSAQIRAARSLLRWSAEDLARRSLLSVATIRRAELTEDETSMTAANDLAVRRALEAAGVEFIDENGGGPGGRLRQRRRPQPPHKKNIAESHLIGLFRKSASGLARLLRKRHTGTYSKLRSTCPFADSAQPRGTWIAARPIPRAGECPMGKRRR